MAKSGSHGEMTFRRYIGCTVSEAPSRWLRHPLARQLSAVASDIPTECLFALRSLFGSSGAPPYQSLITNHLCVFASRRAILLLMRDLSRTRAQGRRKLPFDRTVQVFTLLAGGPAVMATLILLAYMPWPWSVRVGVAVLISGVWIATVVMVRERVLFPIRTLTNLLAALREGDYSLRARAARQTDSLGEVMKEVNALGNQLLVERRQATEASALLKAVIDAVEIAVFTFDEKGKLRLMNPAGANLLVRTQEQALGHDAQELGLDDCLAGDPVGLVERDFPGRAGTRWGLRRTTFREGGRPHQLLVLTDLGRALREEERLAWQRLIRVLGHEINNSLAPIQSIAESLSDLLVQTPATRPRTWETDLQGGMSIIRDRASALGRFMTAYARLARLPPPTLRPVELGPIIQQVAALETRVAVKATSTEKAVVNIDRDQIEQLLINLVRNAADASLEKGKEIEIAWSRAQSEWVVQVIDEGSGIANPTNLFVPFFTTKSSGSGIGLVLSRQIAEAHGGSLTLENRSDGVVGCIAELRLPVLDGKGQK
jgi:two-component system nitrogen regulation sensor histidine kinase NtrY